MIKRLLTWVALAGSMTSCGDTTTPNLSTSISCDSNSVAILVWDTYVENFCGCEGAGQNGVKQSPPTALDCQVSQGKTVWFYLMSDATDQQIVSSDSSAKFTPSFIHVPKNKRRAWAHPVVVTEASTTWSYKSFFNSSINGTLTIP